MIQKTGLQKFGALGRSPRGTPRPLRTIELTLSVAREIEGDTVMEYQEFQFCQVEDQGVALIASLIDHLTGEQLDIRSATDYKIRLGYPGGISRDFAAQFLTDGSDGKLVYTTMAGDLDQAGEYAIQGVITMGGLIRSSDVALFEVRENIPTPVAP